MRLFYSEIHWKAESFKLGDFQRLREFEESASALNYSASEGVLATKFVP